MKRTACNRGLAFAATLCLGLASMARAEIILTADPTSATINTSTLIAATDGIPVSNDAVEGAVIGLTPIKVNLKNTGSGASAKVRISPIGAGSHIQLWAKNTDSNWLDINVTGWLPASGYAMPAGFDRTIDVYAISDAVNLYQLTVNLIKVSDSSVVATTSGTVTVLDLLIPPQNLAASDGTYTHKVLLTWSAVNGAISYEVWRNTNNSVGTASKISDPTGTSYDDTSAVAGTTYFYWVKAMTIAGATTFSASDSGFVGITGPLITANGLVGDVYLNSGDPVTIAVQMMNIVSYLGVDVDWWVVALAGSSWYYMDSAAGWTQEDNWLKWRPVHQGALDNLPATPVLNISGLGAGSYTFYFAVDVPMDGILNNGAGQILANSVNVTVQ